MTPVPIPVANAGSDVFLRGCAAAGVPAHYLNNNRHDCIGCGWCNFGCRYGRKTSMLVTYLPWAEGRVLGESSTSSILLGRTWSSPKLAA